MKLEDQLFENALNPIRMVEYCGPECDICYDKAPYGDERNMWLGYHLSWFHKLGRKITAFFLA